MGKILPDLCSLGNAIEYAPRIRTYICHFIENIMGANINWPVAIKIHAFT